MKENTDIVNKDNLSTKYGVIGGVLLALTLFLSQLATTNYNPYINFLAYIILGIVIIAGLVTFKNQMKGDKIFIKGIGVGTKISLISGLVLVLSNTILFITMRDLAISRFSIPADSVSNFVLISGIMLFECFVVGELFTFITLQSIKEKVQL